MKKKSFTHWIVITLKILVPLAIILWLLSNLEQEQLRQLQQRPKDWGLLGVAFLLSLSAVCLTILRWYLLVRALHIPFRLRDAFRLGFLSYLLNFVSVGSVGGDLFKAFFLARSQPGRRTEAVATVAVDRMIGLYALLLVASGAILLSEMPDPMPEITAVARLTFLGAAIGGVAVTMVLVPGFTSGSLSELLAGLPKIGGTLERLITAVRMYRTKPAVLGVIGLMSLAVHTLFSIGIYLAARALYDAPPTLGEHFIIVPLSMVAGALPLTPAGLGTFEIAVDRLYVWVPAGGATVVPGITVALAFRLMTIGIAAVGVLYYWTSRKEVQQVLEEAESES